MANETSSAVLLFIIIIVIIIIYYCAIVYYYYYLVLILYEMQVGTSHKSKDIRNLRVKIKSRILLVLLQENLFS